MKQRRRGGSLVSRLHRTSQRVFWAMMRRHGLHDLHPEQGKIFFALMDAPDGLMITEIAGRTSLQKSTLTNMLARMEKRGLIDRSPDPEDRRAVRVRLTDHLRAQMSRYNTVSDEITDLYYLGFTDAEIDAFEAMLERIIGNLDTYDMHP